jgi:hypothetical protein
LEGELETPSNTQRAHDRMHRQKQALYRRRSAPEGGSR